MMLLVGYAQLRHIGQAGVAGVFDEAWISPELDSGSAKTRCPE